MAKTMAAAAAKVTFTADEHAMIESCARGVWDYIGYDCLQATADDKGKDVNSVSVSRAVVIELVLDAGRFKDAIKKDKRAAPDFLTRWNSLDYARRIAVVKPAFTYARYGM